MAKKKTVEKKEETKPAEQPKAKVSEVIKAKELVKGSFHVVGNTVVIVAFAKNGEQHRRELDLNGKDSVDMVLA